MIHDETHDLAQNEHIYTSEYGIVLDDAKVKFEKDNNYIMEEREKSPSYMNEIHYHTYYEMFFVADGELTILNENDNIVRNEGIVCIPPFYKHYVVAQGKIYRILFSFGAVDKSKKHKVYDILNKTFSLKNVICFDLNKEQLFYLDQIDKIDAVGNFARQQRVQSAFSLLFTSIIEKIPSLNGLNAVADSKRLNEMLVIEQMVNSNFTEKLTPSMIAEKLHVCTRQVSRIIKQHFNSTLSDLLIAKKIDIAKQYLVNTDMKISEITETLNFQNGNYFYIIFKKKTGYSPLKYRKLMQSQ